MLDYRRARTDDIESLTELNCRLASETEDRSLNRDIVRNGVRRGLELGDEVQYYVATAQGEAGRSVVAQLMITREWSDWRDGWMLWLQSVYVVSKHRRAGVFRRLVEFALNDSRSRQPFRIVRLYVEHNNADAQAVYARLGFQPSGYHVFECDSPDGIERA